jgi:hypothetical protein
VKSGSWLLGGNDKLSKIVGAVGPPVVMRIMAMKM